MKKGEKKTDGNKQFKKAIRIVDKPIDYSKYIKKTTKGKKADGR